MIRLTLAGAYRWCDRKFAPVDRFLNRHTWLLPLIAVLIAIVIFFVNLGTVHDVRTLQTNARNANITACESGNQAAEGNLANLHADLDNLRRERADMVEDRGLLIALAWDRVDLRPILHRRDRRIRHKSAAIAEKEKAIGTLLASRAEYAIHPGSVVKDCEKAYPQ